jgi:cytochrome P450
MAPRHSTRQVPYQVWVRGDLPLLGNLRPFMADPLGFLHGLAQQSGDIVHWKLGTSPAILVTDPYLIGEVFEKVDQTYTLPKLGYSGSFLTGDGVLTASGADWRRKRATVTPAVTPQQVKAYSQIIVERAVERVGTWHNGDRIDLYAEMRDLTRDIGVEAVFGVGRQGEGTGLDEALNAAAREAGTDFREFSVFFPDWLGTASRWRLHRAVKRIDAEVARLIAAYRQRPPARENLMRRLMETRDSEGHPLPDREIRDEAVTCYVAAYETSASILTWSMYLMWRRPYVYRKLLHEVDRVLGGRLPTFEDYASLRYTGQVVRETLRLYPPNWFLAHVAQDGATLGGAPVAKGTMVFTSQWATHRDARWYRAPELFRPERWDPAGETADLPEYAWFPFGGGPKKCPGNHNTRMKVVLVLAVLAQRVRLRIDWTCVRPYPGMITSPDRSVFARVQVNESGRTGS